MTHTLATLFSYSVDSFLLCLAIGWQARSWSKRFSLGLLFGACDAAATVLGSLWQIHFPGLAVYGIYLLFVILLGTVLCTRGSLIYALPVLLSIDNLFGAIPTSLAPGVGLGSAAMALLGLSLAAAAQGLMEPGGSEA